VRKKRKKMFHDVLNGLYFLCLDTKKVAKKNQVPPKPLHLPQHPPCLHDEVLYNLIVIFPRHTNFKSFGTQAWRNGSPLCFAILLPRRNVMFERIETTEIRTRKFVSAREFISAKFLVLFLKKNIRKKKTSAHAHAPLFLYDSHWRMIWLPSTWKWVRPATR